MKTTFKSFYDLLLTCAFIFALNGVHAQIVGPGNVSANIQFWYRADKASSGNTNSSSTWYDYSGNARNATGVNSPGLTSVAANYNPAYSFNGTNQYFTLSPSSPSQMASGTTARTLLLISYPSAAWNSTQDNETGAGQTFSYGLNTSGGYSYRLGAKNSRVVLDRGTGTSNWAAGMGSVPYIAGLANPASATIYFNINGVTQNTSYSGSTLAGTANKANIGRDALGGTRYHNGYIAELVFYNAELTGSDLQKVLSYMALKYGITLGQIGTSAPTATSYMATDGTVYWPTDASFKYDIAGIGRDDATDLYQKQSRSVNNFNNGNMLTISMGSTIESSNAANTSIFPNDLSFFVIGDDGGSVAYNSSPTILTVNGVTESYTRIGRTWKVSNTNDVNGPITLKADLSSYSAGTKPTYLLFGDDANLDGSTTGLGAYSLDGNDQVVINALPNGKYFTYVNSASLATLPVNYIIPLKAANAGNAVLLTWGTSNEINSKGFAVQRSHDGSQFATVGFVKSAKSQMNTGQTQLYEFTDKQPFAGINYYRLLQEDIDGKATIGNTTIVNVHAEPSKLMVSPSLVDGVGRISGLMQDDTIIILNEQGQIKYKGIATSSVLSLNFNNYSSGVYFLKVQSLNGSTRVTRFMKK